MRGKRTGKISSWNTPLEQVKVNITRDAQKKQSIDGSLKGNSVAQTSPLRKNSRNA